MAVRMFDLDASIDCVAPLGTYRVIEYANGDPGKRRVIGDFASFLEAAMQTDSARYPHERRMFTDGGINVSLIAPGPDSQPEAGGES